MWMSLGTAWLRVVRVTKMRKQKNGLSIGLLPVVLLSFNDQLNCSWAYSGKDRFMWHLIWSNISNFKAILQGLIKFWVTSINKLSYLLNWKFVCCRYAFSFFPFFSRWGYPMTELEKAVNVPRILNSNYRCSSNIPFENLTLSGIKK